MQLGAVVVHYRARPQAESAVRALLAGTRVPDRVVLVDNRSGDGSAEVLRESFPDVDVVEAAANRGAAAGMNVGARHLLAMGMEAVLLLTADCRVSASALARLESRLQTAPGVGAVGPLLGRSSAPAEVFSAGGFVDRRTWDPWHHRDPLKVPEWAGAAPRPCDWLDGACVLVRAQAFRETGFLDEHYFHYFDDVDHHLRLRARAWGVECIPTAVAWQEPGRVPPELWVRNRLRFVARHAPRPVLARELARQARCGVRELVGDDRRRAVARLRGAARFLAGHWGPLAYGSR
ncbi:MAG TPA: glycosyltransferase family 2 protein [Acidimicrobiales bacterium]|nr:glycosyltransferase family 2 protein [Acidimicrobiales bacterium]